MAESGQARCLVYRQKRGKTHNLPTRVVLRVPSEQRRYDIHNAKCKVAGEGTVIVKKFVNGVWGEARIENVLYVYRQCKAIFSR